MKSTSLPPEPAPWALTKQVVDEAGLLGKLHLLAPAAEQLHDTPAPGVRFVFVLSGVATVQSGRTNYILQTETSLCLAPGTTCVIRNQDAAPTKVLVVDLPPPRLARDSAAPALLRA